jgi:hypothetical protein
MNANATMSNKPSKIEMFNLEVPIDVVGADVMLV